MDWALECAQNIVEMTGYGQALHINDILPDIRGALTQAAKEAYERGVAEWYKDEEFERGRQAALKEVSVMMRDKPLTMVAASILATLKASKE